MDDDHGPDGITTLRLFPLPGVVFFPHSVLPLHIFEPRYRQMTKDALEGDHLVTIVMIRRAADWEGEGPPPLEEYGCVGRIVKHERLPDGRFNFLLLGLKRVRLLREVPSQTPYRQAEAEVIDDVEGDEPDDSLGETLIASFRRLHGESGVDPDFDDAIGSGLPLGLLSDLLAHAVPLPAAAKQVLLAEPRVEARAATLARWLDDLADRTNPSSKTPRGFPPTFSEN